MKPVTLRNWVLRSKDKGFEEKDLDELARFLSSEADVEEIVAKSMIVRGVKTSKEASEFLYPSLKHLPDPSSMSGIKKAVDRLAKAILQDSEKIVVMSDYDVDGLTSAACLTEILRSYGANVDYFIPLRKVDGYGLSANAIRREAENGCSLILSADCGISAFKEAELAAELGLDLIVTDHHQPSDNLPLAYSIVNPHLTNCQFPFKDLCGVGVAFFLMIALRKELRDRGHFDGKELPNLRKSLDLVALGTVADIVPIHGANRVLVNEGIKVIDEGRRPGLVALKTVAGVKNTTAGSIGFRLGPRLNAVGRLDDGALGAELLLMSCPHESEELANRLHVFNTERKKIEDLTLQEAIERIEENDEAGARSIVLASPGWNSGVIGIVASRLVERYHCPTVLIAIDENGMGKGSARSIKGFHLFHGFQQCADLLVGFGGHEYAAGLSVKSENIAAFAQKFDQVCHMIEAPDLVPKMLYDGEVQVPDLSMRLVKTLERLAPHGPSNPGPIFMSRRVVPEAIKIVGGDHLKFHARQGGVSVGCIAFGMADRKEMLSQEVDILFAPDINEWRGNQTVQCIVKDLRPAM